jgi:Flp pilus assembly protein CpaB
MLGALLVAAAVVGIFAAYSGPRGASRAYVVAARAIRPGDPFTPGDLTRTRVDLPPALRARAFTDSSLLIGATALSPIEAGELVQTGQVIRKRGGARTTALSFPIEASRIGSGLRAGDRVDIVATYGTGTDAYSIVVGRHLQVLSVTRARGTLGGESSAVVLTVALAERADSLALAHATRAAELSVVRTTGATTDDNDPTTYRPAPAAPGVTP